MGKEAKIGVGVILSLLIALGVVIVRRFSATEPPPAEMKTMVGDNAPKLPSLSGSGMQPTVLQPSVGKTAPGIPSNAPNGANWHSTKRPADEATDPRASYMPKPPGLNGADRYATPPDLEADDKLPALSPANDDRGADLRSPANPLRATLPVDDESQDEPARLAATEIAVAPKNTSLSSDLREQDVNLPPTDSIAPKVSPAQSSKDSGKNGDSQVESSEELSPRLPTPPTTAGGASRYTPHGEAIESSGNYRTRVPERDNDSPAQYSSSSARPTSLKTTATHAPSATTTNTYPAYTPAPSNTSQMTSRSAPSYAPVAQVESGRPTRANSGIYHVEPGDSFWKIAQNVYGDGGYFKALQEHNRARYPESVGLDVGDEIATPELDVLHEKYSGLCPKNRTTKPGTPHVSTVAHVRGGRSYVVEEGDTLYTIARYELGDAQRWPEIFQLNRAALGEDIDYLRPGTKLILPVESQDAEQPDALTRKPTTPVMR